MKRAFVVGLGLLALFAASSAQAVDRRPVEINGLTPDNWGQSITAAQDDLRSRFRGIDAVYCTGVIIVGYRSDSSFINGRTRYWDKLACGGRSSGASFVLIYDAKGRSADAWTIYRLRGASIRQLRGF